MNEEYKVVTLEDNSKWFIAAGTIYNDKRYQLLLSIDDAEENFTGKCEIMEAFERDNDVYFDIVQDENLKKTIAEMLMPEAKEYIENPNKLNELIGD